MKLKKFEHINTFDGIPYGEDEDEFGEKDPFDDDAVWNRDSPIQFEGDADEDEEYDEEEDEEDDPKPRRSRTDEEDDLDQDKEDVVKELTYLLRKMIINSGIENFYVSNQRYDISIQFIFQKKEKMANIMKVMNLLKKINGDILIQYDSEIELWETTKRLPMLTVDFYYEANKKGDKTAAPFK